MWGTSGNLSLRLKSHPLEFAITPSGLNKGHLTTSDLLTIKEGSGAFKHPKKLIPSAEMAIHQAVYRAAPGAGAVFHVHPIYSTLISSFYGHPREKRLLKVDWIEMMKGVGVSATKRARKGGTFCPTGRMCPLSCRAI